MASLSREEKLQLASQKLRQFQQSKQAQVEKVKETSGKPVEPVARNEPIHPQTENRNNVPPPTTIPTATYGANFGAYRSGNPAPPTVVDASASQASNYAGNQYSLQPTVGYQASGQNAPQTTTDSRSLPTSSTEQIRELVAHCNTLLSSVEMADDDTTIESESDVEGTGNASLDSRHRYRLDDEQTRADAETERLRQRNLELVKMIETLRSEGESRRIELAKYKRLFESLEREYGEALHSNSPQQALSALQRSVEQLAAECADQSSKIFRAETERAELLRQLESANAENGELRRKLAFIEQQNVALQDAVSRAARDSGKLEHELVASRAQFDAEKSRFERELSRLETEMAAQKSAIQSELETARADCRRSEADFVLFKAQLTKQSEEKLQLAEQIEQLKAERRGRHEKEGELSEARATMGRARMEFDAETRRLRTELDAEYRRANQLESRLQALSEDESKQHQRWHGENAALKRALEEVAMRFAALETTERDTAARLAATFSDLEAARTQLTATQQKAAERDRVESRLLEQSRKFDADLRLKHERILELETVIEDRDARLQRAEIDLRNGDAELLRLRNLEPELRNAQNELIKLRQSEQELRNLQAELSNLRNQTSELNRLRDLETQLQNAESEISHLRNVQNVNLLNNSNQELSQLRDMQQEIARLRSVEKDLHNAESELSRLRAADAELSRLREVETELLNTRAELSRLRNLETELNRLLLVESNLNEARLEISQLRAAQTDTDRLRDAEAALSRLHRVEAELQSTQSELQKLRSQEADESVKLLNLEAEVKRLRNVEVEHEWLHKSAATETASETASAEAEQLCRVEAEAEQHVEAMRLECERYVADVQQQFDMHVAQLNRESEQRIADAKSEQERLLAESKSQYDEQCSALRNEAAEANRQLEAVRADNLATRQRYEQALNALQSELIAECSVRVASQSQQSTESSLAEENCKLRRELETLIERLQATESSIDELRTSESTLTTRCAELSNRVALSEAHARAAVSDVERERLACSQLTARLRDAAALSDAFVALRNEAEASRNEAQLAIAERQKLAGELDALRTERVQLLSQLSIASASLSKKEMLVQSSLSGTKVDSASATDELTMANLADNTDEKSGEGDAELRRVRALLVRREAEVHQLGAELTRLSAERTASETRCAQQESVAAFLRRRNAELEHSVEQLSAECESIGDYIAMYHSQRHALMERVQRKKTLLHRLIYERRHIDNALNKLRVALSAHPDALASNLASSANTFAASHWPKLDSDSESECDGEHGHDHNHDHDHDHDHAHEHEHLHPHNDVNEAHTHAQQNSNAQLSTYQLNSLVRIVNELDSALKNDTITGLESEISQNRQPIADINSSESHNQPTLVGESIATRRESPVAPPSPPLDRVMIDDAYFAPCKHCSGKLITV